MAKDDVTVTNETRTRPQRPADRLSARPYRAFLAPDPGRTRLRTASRAVLGVALAVASPAAAGLSLEACVIGGLAALLALFTVTDPSVRGQALTTALLPAVGVPVLTLALALQGQSLARDAAFLAVAFGGAYARRWGPRGQALGIFGFMMYFAAQFLTTDLRGAGALHAAMLLGLTAAGVVRFGLWCLERHTPPPAVPAPAGGRGLARPTTRLAVQTAVACAFALAVGQLLSAERWYWAVGAAWWIFVNTASRGETLVRGFRRVLGTFAGIVAGLWVAVPVDGAPLPTAALLAVCVFGLFYTAAVSYSWMMFFVTVLVGLLYGVLGVLDPGLLQLRLAETAVGALGAGLAVALVLPVTTHSATHHWIQRTVQCVHTCARDAARRLAGDENADPASRIADLELLLGRVRASLAPLVHPLSPLKARRARAREVLALLDDCAREVRGLAAVAADPDASHDARLVDACRRVEAAVHRLTEPAARCACHAGTALTPATSAAAGAPMTAASETAASETAAPVRGTAADGAAADGADGAPAAVLPPRHPGADRALGHLRGLETALVELAEPVHTPPRAPLTTAA